jgi:hypothetical protein
MLTAMETLAGWRRCCLMVAVAATGAAALFVTPAMAVGGPLLSIKMTHANLYGAQGGVDPHTLSGETFAQESADNSYTITVKNTGETATSGEVSVEDRLPKGIVFALNEFGEHRNVNGFSCAIVPEAFEAGAHEGSRAVKCSRTGALLPGASFEPLTLNVRVTLNAGNPSVNAATVSGGGAVSASTTEKEGETVVAPAVPFGIACFATSVEYVEQLEYDPCNKKNSPEEKIEPALKPFTQAGGHPFAYTTETVFNYTTNIHGVLAIAGGASKDVEVELPPGFTGDPQNTPRCPLELLKGGACPTDTAVGYTVVNLGAHVINGKPVLFPLKPVPVELTSLVFNMEPPPGHPAELGFVVIKGLPIVLEAELRSDGDYGVTVGDSSGSNGAKLLAVKLTTCENGASGVAPNFHCNPVIPGSRPFLTNPTECSSPPPVTTARANRWGIEPAELEYTSKKAYAGSSQEVVAGAPNASESFVEGCNLLQFQPEIEFKPSPASEGGTSAADEPTGVTFNLKLPQTNEPNVPATPAVRDVVMKLPEGMTASPSAAHGLQACSNAQFGLGTEFGPGAPKIVPEPPAKAAECPVASQIGTVEVFTPLLSGAPTIEGVPKIGEELTCSQGMWKGSPTLSYQWLLNGAAIEGATGREYRLPPTEAEYAVDQGKPVQCKVTATNPGGSSVAVSREVVLLPEPTEASKQPPTPPSSIAAPSGAPSVGSTLTCTSEAWTGSPTLTYTWLRGGAEIAGASTATYTPVSADEGKAIQCQVRGKNAGGEVIADSAGVIVSPVPSPAPPLPGAAVQGQMFIGQPECSPCSNEDAQDGKLFRLFIQAQDPSAGVIVKLHGFNRANPETGQLEAVFEEQPQQPFELFSLKLKGGPTAPLANAQRCGLATTTTDLTPWSAPGLGGLSGTEPIAGTPDAHPSSSFEVGAGEACPATLPFAPSFNAGTTGASATAADTSPTFSVTFARNDREQDLSGFTMHMPLGLVAKVPAVKECGEAEMKAAENNAGGCPAESEIGTATTLAGPGPDPFSTQGHVYFTGPYDGGPFGVVVVTLAKAGPFNLGNVVVRSAITINPNTAAVTVTTPKLPQIVSGIPIRLRAVNVAVTKPGFMLNPTNCNEQQVSGALAGAEGAGAQVSSPFGITGCKNLPFKPTFTASTQAHTSKTEGASLNVKVTYPPGAYANIAKTVTDLPMALPSRLTTIQKACVDTVFEANPAACPEGSVVGYATAHTPVLNQPLVGPAYLISHGARSFPDIEIVLQAEGVKVVLDGLTDIKKGVTKTSFEAIPDAPISTFELNLPEGPHSALAANIDLCSQALELPTELTGQNGAVIKQATHIAVTGCPPTVSISKLKLAGNALLVTVKASAKGTVTISGNGLKTTKKNLKSGTYQIRVALTKMGRSLRVHHKQAKVRVSLTVGKQVVAKATTVRL